MRGNRIRGISGGWLVVGGISRRGIVRGWGVLRRILGGLGWILIFWYCYWGCRIWLGRIIFWDRGLFFLGFFFLLRFVWICFFFGI